MSSAPHDPTSPYDPPHGSPSVSAYEPPQDGPQDAPTYPPPPAESSYPAAGEPMPTYSHQPVPSTDSSLAMAAFIIGIFSLVGFVILGPLAIVLSNKAIRQIDAAPGVYTNRGLAVVGRVLGIIATVLLGLGVIFIAVVVVAFVRA